MTDELITEIRRLIAINKNIIDREISHDSNRFKEGVLASNKAMALLNLVEKDYVSAAHYPIDKKQMENILNTCMAMGVYNKMTNQEIIDQIQIGYDIIKRDLLSDSDDYIDGLKALDEAKEQLKYRDLFGDLDVNKK